MTNDESQVLPPNIPTIEEPPEPKWNNNGERDGIGLINLIMDIFSLRDTPGLTIIKKYKRYLGINENDKWIYRLYLVLFLTLDWLVGLSVVMCIVVVLLLIIFVFARGIGVIDWINQIVF